MNIKVDIVVVGGGLVGASFAALLANTPNLTIALIDKQALPTYLPNDPRVSAIGPASVKLFQKIKAFEKMQAVRVSPYTGMDVWDGGSAGYVHFEAADLGMRQLGYIIENSLMQTAVHETLADQPNITRLMSVTPHSFQSTDAGVTLTLASGVTITAGLAVAADGARSWLREAAGISVTARNDHESALVAYVKTEKPHHQVARQLFLPTGPLAFLPLAEPTLHSIVWSLPDALAKENAALPDDEFSRVLSRAFENRLGNIQQVMDRHVFPLIPQQANAYVKPGVALLGDAAHTMHPLAGLGVNLGLSDAANLADVILKAKAANETFSNFHVLRRYARCRAAENQLVLTGVDLIKRCFAINQPTFRVLRGMGMNVTERVHGVKKAMVKMASLD